MHTSIVFISKDTNEKFITKPIIHFVYSTAKTVCMVHELLSSNRGGVEDITAGERTLGWVCATPHQ